MKSLSLDSPESQETLKDKRTLGAQTACASSSNTPPYEPMAEIFNYKYKGKCHKVHPPDKTGAHYHTRAYFSLSK